MVAQLAQNCQSYAYSIITKAGRFGYDAGMVFIRSAAHFRRALMLSVLAAAALFPGMVSAQSPFQIGSTNPAVAEPPVSRPATQPIAVPLFHDFTFTDYASKPFSYTPPAGHAQRWAKIILVADFSVTAGRQFDRSGEISIGHTNVYFGTTAEPSDAVSPAWHVERDVTEYAALLKAAHPGETTLGNTVDSKYTGIIHGSASLLFYPLAPHQAPPAVPDLVLPLPASSNGIGSANSPADTLTETYTLPTNCVRVYLDLITESQGNDEFWYLNAPDALTAKLKTGGRTAFREAEITVDGAPAGVAPVFPWIYTGGIDPGLWRPIPGLQTLNLAPYRVDLTPFAGRLNNGRPHKIGVRIFNNNNHFQIAGTLLIFRDPRLKTVHGALTLDTLAANPVPIIQSNLTDTNGEVAGPVSVAAGRRFTVAGYVLTSLGKVSTRITQTVRFSSVQQFDMSAKTNSQIARQIAAVSSVTETRTPASTVTRQDKFRYPLTVRFRHMTNADGSASQTTAIEQGDIVFHQISRHGVPIFSSLLRDTVSPTDTLHFNAAGKAAQQTRQSAQTYSYADTAGRHFARTLTADKGVLRSVTVK